MYGPNASIHTGATGPTGAPAGLTLLPHASAFHPPLADLKNQAAAAAAASTLSMDWFARAGLLYHRTPGKREKKKCSSFLLYFFYVFFLVFLSSTTTYPLARGDSFDEM